MLEYFDYPYSRPEEITGDYIIATYLISVPSTSDILKKAGSFAIGQTIGTWVRIPGVTQRMIEEYQAKIVSIEVAPVEQEQLALLRIAFPAVNFARSISMMLTGLLGNDVSTALRNKLLDIELTGGAKDLFKGPQKSIEELRELTGVYDRPLVLNMIKPCVGFSPKEGAALFYKVASGGVDIIKDDELLGNTGYNAVAERVKEYTKAAQAAAENTGRQTVYLVNITDRPSRMRDNAKAAIEAGAKGCLINFVFAGADSLLDISEEFGDELFIMAHYAGAGVMSSRKGGIADPVLLGLLPRYAGAHAVMTMTPTPDTEYEFYKTVQAQRMPLGKIKPVVTTVGGGITPTNAERFTKELGNDIILGVGGAVQGHPDGASAGASAMVAAVEAASKGIPICEAAQSNACLKKALAHFN